MTTAEKKNQQNGNGTYTTTQGGFQLKYNQKLGRTFIVTVVFALVTMLFTLLVTEQASVAKDEQYLLVNAALDLREASRDLTSDIRAYVATGNSEYYDDYMEIVNTKVREIAVAKLEDTRDDSQQALGCNERQLRTSWGVTRQRPSGKTSHLGYQALT